MTPQDELDIKIRLAILEQKVDDYLDIRDVVKHLQHISDHNQERLDKLEDSSKYLFRTAIGAILASAIAIIFHFIDGGLGINS